MRYAFSEEQLLLRSSLEKFLASKHDFRRRGAGAAETGLDRGLWRGMADLGLLGLPFAEELGGAGGSALDVLLVMEAFGRALVAEPYLSAIVLAGGALRHGATAAQQAELIPPIISGERLYALAFAEPGSRFNLRDVATTARADGDGYVLDGRKSVVYGAPSADALLVVARTSGVRDDEAGVSLFLTPRDTPGLMLRDYPTVDGFRAGDVTLAGVRLPASALLGAQGGAFAAVARAVDEAAAASCADVVGAMEALTEKTTEHCRTRVAFDQPLGKFQVVQHRLVDMHIAYEHAAALALKAALSLANDDAPAASRSVSAAKFQVGEEADFVGKNAVQLHGANGMTDELDIGRYFKRITAQRALFGTPDHHLRRYIALKGANPAAEADEDYDFDLTDEDVRFRDELRTFFAKNVTDEMRQAAANTMWAFAEFEYGRRFQKILHAHGYGAPDWPVEYGGKDWTPSQRMIWALEYLRAGAPEVMRMGRNLCAPCIMQFGTPEQKAQFLPAILAGEDWWAQGYSEPGAGSDLAALKTSAVRDGDCYVVNGSKIWTTYAHHANKIFCLVRTDGAGRKQAGITFLLIDMDTPGIEVRPIVNIAGDHEFNQVFFTDVRVPVSRRLGEEHEGWKVARHLLGLEHGAFLVQANAETTRRLRWVREVAGRETDGGGGRLLDDADFARRLAELEIGLQALDFAASQVWGGPDGGAPSQLVCELLTIRNREIDQALTQLAVDAVGYYALPFEPEARKVGSAIPPVGGAHTLLPTALYLSQRAATIARGTPEIHRNNLARHLLRL